MKIIKSESGIAHLFLISFLLVIVAVGGAGYYVYSNQQSDKTTVASGEDGNLDVNDSDTDVGSDLDDEANSDEDDNSEE